MHPTFHGHWRSTEPTWIDQLSVDQSLTLHSNNEKSAQRRKHRGGCTAEPKKFASIAANSAAGDKVRRKGAPNFVLGHKIGTLNIGGHPQLGLTRASVKLFELGVRTYAFLGVWYARGRLSIFGVFRTPSLPIFGVGPNFWPRSDEYV